MRLSNLADYAVVLLSAAARAGSGRLNASLLAEQTGVPLPTAQKLVGRLASAGILVSSRGTGGGFRLARPPRLRDRSSMSGQATLGRGQRCAAWRAGGGELGEPGPNIRSP